MSRIRSIFCCLSLSLVMAKADMICPDPQEIGYLWKKGGREIIYSTLKDKMPLSINDDPYHFPDVPFQLTSYIDHNDDFICQYHSGSPEPFIRLNMGKINMKKIENPRNQNPENEAILEKQKKEDINNPLNKK